MDFRLAEETDLHTLFREHFLKAAKLDVVAVTLYYYGLGSRCAIEFDLADREAEQGAGVQGELREVLGYHSDHTRVVRARGDLAEDYLITLDEHLHTEDAPASEGAGNFGRNLASLGDGRRSHRLRLPGFTVVAVHLMVADRLEYGGTCAVANGEHSDFIVEIHETLDYHPSCSGTSAFL